MFGTYKGKTGITEQKLGGKWTCKLDCVAERQSFKSEQLHATAPAASDATLTAFEPKVLDTALPVGEIAAFISNLQLDPDQPVELRQLHPESGTMLDLMTRVLLPSELDDDMLRRLRFCRASGGALQQGWGAVSGGAAGPHPRPGLGAARVRRGAYDGPLPAQPSGAAGGPGGQQQQAVSAAGDCGAAAAAGLQPTEVRAGKQQRRADLRGPTDRKVKPLLPRQKGDGSTLRQRRGGQQQQQEVAPEDRCDPLPKATKRGKQVDKKRGLTIKGNVDGTVIRNGAAHTRYSAGKKQKQQ